MAVKPVTHRGETLRIAYDILHPEAKKDLVILHGWGSDKELMKRAFGGAFTDWRHIYVDLPGFGKSENPLVLESGDYAEIVAKLLESLGARPDAAVGHSFGGKVATLLDPQRLVLLSSAGIVLPKPLSVRAKIALFKLLKPFGGGRFRHLFASADAAKMPQNMYETFKKVVDEDFSSKFAAYDKPALLCWGSRDTATPPEAGRRIAELMPDARLKFFDGDHYFFLQRPAETIATMKEFFDETV